MKSMSVIKVGEMYKEVLMCKQVNLLHFLLQQ